MHNKIIDKKQKLFFLLHRTHYKYFVNPSQKNGFEIILRFIRVIPKTPFKVLRASSPLSLLRPWDSEANPNYRRVRSSWNVLKDTIGSSLSLITLPRLTKRW